MCFCTSTVFLIWFLPALLPCQHHLFFDEALVIDSLVAADAPSVFQLQFLRVE